ncbi:MAG: transposase family protein, partial [Gammaproteobacteria bacterium]|nr:transposase family protein [Gammaproteobacteria bacterium]
EDKKFDVFRMAHDIPSSGHFGIHATTAMALQHFWYPGLNADIRNRIRACLVCINKDIRVRNRAGAYVRGTNGFPGQTLYVDLVQMNKSPEGYEYILSMEDRFSRFISLALLKCKRSEEVIQGLLEHFISRFGCPLTIHSDNGREFTNQLLAKLLAQLEVAHTFTPAYNPQSNNVERFHRTLRDHYRMWIATKDEDWVRQLPCLELAYNYW